MHMPTPACSPQLLKVTSFGRKRTEVQFELKRNNESSMSFFFFLKVIQEFHKFLFYGTVVHFTRQFGHSEVFGSP